MLSRCILSLVLVGVVTSSAAAADTEPPSPALPYAVAGLSTLLILFTICKPSKKTFYED